MFQAPGGLNELSDSLLPIWNEQIRAQIKRLYTSGYGRHFFIQNPADITDGQVVNGVKWSGAPAEPGFCLDRTWAQRLSDWGIKGRHETQNEYCEYLTHYAVDGTGRVRPKRVDFTSELREYWVLLAEYDPDALKNAAKDVLGTPPTWNQLYGHADPKKLTQQQRRVEFGKTAAGHGSYQDMQQAGVPPQPTGAINRDNLLFMTHPINGLDDLVYVVMFGATPYRVKESGVPRKALLQEIFRHFGVEHLACRNADPAAAAGPLNAVWDGRSVAFASNLGMYLRLLSPTQFEYNGSTIPQEWIRFSRGQKGMYQRLSFGPSDEDDAFLDDIFILQGTSKQKITGGFQVAELIEVGPLVVVSKPSEVDEDDYLDINANPTPINCREAKICTRMKLLKAEYESSANMMSTGRRTISRVGVL